MKPSFAAVLCAALCAGLLAGCAIGPNYQRPEITTPAGWRTAEASADSIANLAWWEFYQDPVLTNLIAVALSNNFDLRIAAARVEEAAAGYTAQRSYLFPTLDASGNWTRARIGDLPLGAGRTGNQYDLFGFLSYEVDLWGRLRRLTEASRASLLAAEEGRRTVYLGLVSAVASAYFDLRALDEQWQIAQRTAVSRSNSLELTHVKFNHGQGVVSELDIRQAETLFYGALAAEASLERLMALRENELSLLLGQNPGPIPRGRALDKTQLVERIPAGLPSELLLRRPDIRAAEQQLIAANANIGAARAAFFPTISLTAALGLQSVELDDLFSAGASRAWKFAPQVAAPIFNAGRISAGVRAAKAHQQAALAEYERSIRNGFREVDDALVSIQTLGAQLDAQEKAVVAERARLELSELRYNGGVAGYNEVLDAQRYLFSAELELASLRRARLTATVQLYKALGGGWKGQLD